MINEETPRYDKLQAQRETVLLGLAAAQHVGSMERAHWYQLCLEEVDRAIQALIQPIDRLAALKARRRQCEAMIDKKPEERQAWAKKAFLINAQIERMEATL